MGCISQFSGTTTVSARGNTSEIQVSGDISMWAQPITVEFQDRDLSLFGSATDDGSSSDPTSGGTVSTVDLPTPTTSDPDSTSSSTSSPDSSVTPTQGPSSSGLSTAAQAGIGVGVGLAALALIAALSFFIRRRRRNAFAPNKAGVGAGYAPDSKEPMRQPEDWERRELDASEAAQHRSELDGRATPPGERGQAAGRRVDPRLRQQPGQFSELE
jgi:hypothetical protein